MIRLLSILVALIVAGLLCPARKYIARANEPVTTSSLKELGYERPKRWLLPAVQVEFISDSGIAVSFPTRNQNLGLDTRSQHNSSGYLFKTVIVDSKTARVVNQRLWGNFKYDSRLIPLPSGRFLLRDNGELRLYSDDFQLIGATQLPTHVFVNITLSFDGTRVFISWSDQPGRDRVDVIDIPAMSKIGTFEIPTKLYHQPTGGLTGIVYRPDLNEPQLILQPYKGGPTLIRPTPPLGCGARAEFIADALLALAGQCHSLAVMKENGQVLKEISLGKKQPGEIIPIKESNHFCAETHRVAGGSRFFDIDSHLVDRELVCFDYDTGRQVSSFSLPSTMESLSPIAVSPDASRLAFVDGDTVKIVELRNH